MKIAIVYLNLSWQSGGPLRLFSFGIFSPHRHFEDVLKVVAGLRKKGIDARASIQGSGGDPRSYYARKLFASRSDLGLENFASLRFGWVGDEELKKMYAEHDIFVFPTYIDCPRNGYGWGLAAFEIMAAGLPVALYKTTASARLLEDSKTAIIVDPLRPDLIADRIAKVACDPQRLYALARGGQELVKTMVTWENYALQMLDVFRSCGAPSNV